MRNNSDAAVATSANRAPVLKRETFTTSRHSEFTSQKELVAQTGHPVEQWPSVALKELIDNALDGAEDAGIAPIINLQGSAQTGDFTVADNGPGVAPETIAGILDYTVRVSSREAYVSPTRGAQGNALKTIIAMPFAIDGERGETVIESRGIAHHIVFEMDPVRRVPKISHRQIPSPITTGTKITVRWPDSARSILVDAKPRFLQMISDFEWLNPHLSIHRGKATNAEWSKWRGRDPTSAHWYTTERFERYIAAHIAHDEDNGRSRTVREFISELRGLSGSAKQKLVLDEAGLARVPLSSLFGRDGGAHDDIARLLAACRKHTKPVKPADLGLIGKDHLLAKFKETGVQEKTFKYQKHFGMADDGLPWIVETAFGWCPKINERRIITGVNWSVALGNPFRSFGRYGDQGLESILAEQRAGRDEPIVFVLHFACPRVEFTDRGKSALIIPGDRR